MKSKTIKTIEVFKYLDGLEIKQGEGKVQSYKKHLHKELSIGLIESGSAVVDFDAKHYTLETNDLIIIPPLLSHRCSPENVKNWKFVMMYIDPTYYAERLDFSQVLKVQGQLVLKYRHFIEQIFSGIPGIRVEDVLIDLLDDLEQTSSKESLFDFQRDHVGEIERIKRHIEAYYMEEMDLGQLESKFAMNKFTLIRKFKAQFNTTPNAYRLQLKIAEAKKRLDMGSHVLDICSDLGFYDQAHFIREFKRMHGVTPMAYLKRIHQERK